MSSYQHYSGEQLVYSREKLLALQTMGRAGMVHPIPEELRRRRRGSRAGEKVKARIAAKWSKYKPSLSWEMLTVWPTRRTRWLLLWGPTGHSGRTVYWNSLKLGSPRTHRMLMWMYLDSRRWDSDCRRSGKSKGGGLARFINNRWSSPGHVTVKETECNRDIELLAVGLRP